MTYSEMFSAIREKARNETARLTKQEILALRELILVRVAEDVEHARESITKSETDDERARWQQNKAFGEKVMSYLAAICLETSRDSN